MKLEPNICPVCWAFQDPDTGKCLVCGEKYHILDVPVSLNPNQEPYFGKFLIPCANGFFTFYANAQMEFIHPPSGIEGQIKLIFDFIPDDKTQALLQLYTGAAL